MSTSIDNFLAGVHGFWELPAPEQNKVLLYYMTVVRGAEGVTASQVDKERAALKLPPFRTAQQFSTGTKRSKSTPPTFLKRKVGYVLSRLVEDDVRRDYVGRPTARQVSTDLRCLLGRTADPHLEIYLKEAIGCFEAKLFRASVVFGWCIGYSLLRNHILSKHLLAFNGVIAGWKNPKPVKTLDDFQEHAERVVIDTARSAHILTKEQHKLLVALLDQRNSYAHPSGRKISSPIAEAFLRQILDEVVPDYT